MCGPAEGIAPPRGIHNRNTKIEPKIVRPSGLDHDLLDPDAVRSLERLQDRGFQAYLVGGCVRDLLLGKQPKDFDIATEARPQQVKRTFPRNCRIIGRRFKLAHLHFNHNRKIIEVATFRTAPSEGDANDDLLITRDNEFGTAEEDAVRRDFTVNGLFFDPISDSIIDYVEGLPDIEKRVIRTIGDPAVRFREDPIRIIRAAKFSGRLDLSVDGPTYEAMSEVAPDLSRSAPPRMLEEILRLLRGGHSLESFQLLRDIDALPVILPVVAKFLEDANREDRIRFWRTLEALDARIVSGAEIPNPVLLGVLFSAPVRARAEQENRRSWTTVAEAVIGPFAAELRLPRRDAGCLKRICGVQPRFVARGPKRFKTGSFLRDPYFEEAIALFELSCIATGTGMADLERWRGLRAEMVDELRDEAGGDDDHEAESESGEREGGRRRRRRGGRNRNRGGSNGAVEARSEESETGSKRRRGRRGRRDDRDRDRDRDRDEPQKGGKKSRSKGNNRGKQKGRRSGGRGARRDNTVETIEPETFDLSAFDMELDPKRVPTFGVIVEGDSKKKRKAKMPKAPLNDQQEDYRPPPPPSSDSDPAPPPPPRDDDFGDW